MAADPESAVPVSPCLGGPMRWTLILLALPLGSCDRKDAGPAPAAGKLTIAMIPKGTTHEFWKSVHFGAEQAAKEFSVELLWKGPLQENDRQGQINEVET